MLATNLTVSNEQIEKPFEHKQFATQRRYLSAATQMVLEPVVRC